MQKKAKSFLNLSMKFLKKSWVWIVSLSVVVTIVAIFVPMPLTGLFKSDHDKFMEENFIHGLLIPNDNASASPNIYVKTCGGYWVFSKYDLINEKKMPGTIACAGDTMIRISIKIVDNRLYISTIFNDINNNEVIGIIKNGQWYLLKKNMLNYYSDDKTLEVIDKYNNVVLRLSSINADTISLDGYFSSTKSISVVSKSGCGCFPKSESNRKLDSVYKANALKEIKKIIPTHYFGSN